MFTNLQYQILKRISPGEPASGDGSVYDGKSKLRILLGDEFLSDLRNKVVIDFGCGEGEQALEIAAAGARKVIGVDIREAVLGRARQRSRQAGLDHVVEFATAPAEQADLIVSLDSFEHFADPADILRIMSRQLTKTGSVLVSFGPTWYHPLGGHLFSVFPWAHLIFSERALIRWRQDLRSDGATKFEEVEGGLNQMTIRRFERIVRDSDFRLAALEAVPIRRLSLFHNSLTREFTTAIVRCRLSRS